MEGLFTPNFEEVADRVAPKLAKVNVAAGLYFWLHSRAFGAKNNIGISVRRLASILGVNTRSVSRAIVSLIEAGLITKDAYRGNGGGSVFHICVLENKPNSSHLSTNKCDEFDLFNVTHSAANTADTSNLMRQECHPTERNNKDKGDDGHIYGIYD